MKKFLLIYFLLLIAHNIFSAISASSSVSRSYILSIHFNKELLPIQSESINLDEFKVIKKGAKKKDPYSLMMYAEFILKNHKHELIKLKKDDYYDKYSQHVFTGIIQKFIAQEYFKEAAILGNPIAQYKFSRLSSNYIVDGPEIQKYMIAAAEANYQPAMTDLATAYINGASVTYNGTEPYKSTYIYSQDYSKAKTLLEKINDPSAKLELGKLYLTSYANINNFTGDINFLFDLFDGINQSKYLESILSQIDDYHYLINHNNLFPKLKGYLPKGSYTDIDAKNLFTLIASEYPDLKEFSKYKSLELSILDNVSQFTTNHFAEYEANKYKEIKNYHNYTVEYMNNEVKYSKINEYLKKFPNGIYKDELTSYQSEIVTNSFESIDKNDANNLKKFLSNFNEISFKDEVNNLIATAESNAREEKLRQERIAKERYEHFKPQIQAYKNLGENYAYKLMKTYSPNTGRNYGYRFDSEKDYELDERKVTLYWEDKATWLDPYRTLEVYGTINVREGRFSMHSANSYFQTSTSISSAKKDFSDMSSYALKSLGEFMATDNSYPSSPKQTCFTFYEPVYGEEAHSSCPKRIQQTYKVKCKNDKIVFIFNVLQNYYGFGCEAYKGDWFIWNRYSSNNKISADNLEQALNAACGCY